ncbi:MAG: phosphoribosylformylglycinamidine synthase subunit PurS [Dehalococcoidia bacterium]|nr:phosphoribosylformylglycinamidine synthase subunit PurS [Dehalococcoidia bacterium]MCB9485952.1 phosphoribosylformylglycinamidine synthase subunit PurS [Thermoflexaceae bacterium]
MAKDSKKHKQAKSPKEQEFLARVYVSLKPTVNDPEGNTIASALDSLGFGGIDSVRAGKYFQVRLRAPGPKEAKKSVDQMCSRLLANPVIEAYRFDVDVDGNDRRP